MFTTTESVERFRQAAHRALMTGVPQPWLQQLDGLLDEPNVPDTAAASVVVRRVVWVRPANGLPGEAALRAWVHRADRVLARRVPEFTLDQSTLMMSWSTAGCELAVLEPLGWPADYLSNRPEALEWLVEAKLLQEMPEAKGYYSPTWLGLWVRMSRLIKV